MADAVALVFRAFLSYSHADSKIAKTLHKRIESFVIQPDLAGRVTPQGPVPKSLRPVFRDRDDFSAGHSLTEQTLDALDRSAALIVLCSPASARSTYVNEEVRLFKSRHPSRPIIPVVVELADGQPAFPPALARKLSAAGVVTDVREELLAADLRDDGDGPNLALAKVVARMLGVPTDEIARRAAQERARAARRRKAVMATLAGLTVFATLSAAYAWHQLKTNEAFLEATLSRATDIVNTSIKQAEIYNVPRTATLELLTRAEGLFDDMTRLGRPTPALQRQKAWMLIQFARNYWLLGDTTKRRALAEEASRIMATLIDGPGRNDAETQRVYAEAADERGRVLEDQGDLAGAMAAHQIAKTVRERFAAAPEASALDKRPEIPPCGLLRTATLRWQCDLSISVEAIGTIHAKLGDLAAADATLRQALEQRETVARADPEGGEALRNVSVVQEKLGDVLFAQRRFSEASKIYRDSLLIAERLAQMEPARSARQHDLAIAHAKVGEVQSALRDFPTARTAFTAARGILERLVAIDPRNTAWQHDLMGMMQRLGNTALYERAPDEAMAAYQTAHKIALRLAAADPRNATWQRDLSVSYNLLGEASRQQKNIPEALAAYRAALAVRQKLAASDPGNAGWQRDLALSHSRIAQVLREQGQLDEALVAQKASLAIVERLSGADPTHATRMYDMAKAQTGVANLLQRLDRKDEALTGFERALAHFQELQRRNSDDLQSRIESTEPLQRLGQLKGPAGRHHLEAGRDILKPLAAEKRLSSEALRRLDEIEAELAAHR